MVSLSLEIWSSNSMVPFLAITCHFVRRDTDPVNSTYKHEAFLLNFGHLPGSHEAENQEGSIKKCAEDYGIQNSVRCLTADNAAVNAKSMVELEQLLPAFSRKDCSIGCMAHALNVSAQNLLKERKADIDPINESEARLNADETMENSADRQNGGNSEDSEAAVVAIFRVARKIVVKAPFGSPIGKQTRLFLTAVNFHMCQCPLIPQATSIRRNSVWWVGWLG
jgi:hypothetical protein